MAKLQFYERSSQGDVPIADYTAAETIPIMRVEPGEVMGYGFAHVSVVFDGSGTVAVLIVGDEADPNRFFEDGNIDEETTGIYTGKGAGLDNNYLYTTGNTIDVGFTADTNSDGTTGLFDVWFYIAKVQPLAPTT